MKKFNKIYEIISTILLILLILILPIVYIIYIDNAPSSKVCIYLHWIGIISIILYILFKIINKEKLKTKDIIIVILVIFAFLSYHFAINKEIALDGMTGRREGLKSILSYYAIFLLATTIPKKNQSVIMKVFLGVGIFQIFVGTIQTMQLQNILGYSRANAWSTNYKFASGTFGNPNFYSTYILLGLLYSFGLLMKDKKRKSFIVNLILTIIFSYGLIIGNTISCILAFIIVVIFCLCKKINKKNYKKSILGFVIVLSLLISIALVSDKFLHHRITYSINKNINEISDIFKNGINDQTGNGRIYIWKETIKKFPNHIYTGIGLDNFALINDGGPICTYTSNTKYECFDKTHNEYLQILITEGLIAFLVYIMFIYHNVYQVFKYKKYLDNHFYGLLCSVISYLIQAVFNISVITVAPIFYMLMGFMNNNDLPLKKYYDKLNSDDL